MPAYGLRALSVAVALASSLLLPAGAGSDPGTGSDPRALEVADRLEKAMGGRERFDAHRFLEFRFAVDRDGKEVANWHHVWDRATGRYLLEGEREGTPLRVQFNVNTREGRVWLGGVLLGPEEAKPHLETAYGRFINDSYWLLMPWKWRDPGVTLRYEGERTVDGRIYDVVGLSFEGVGLTPKDRYWAFVSRERGLLERWEFVLQSPDGSPGTGDPTVFRWEDWKPIGEGLVLSSTKVKVGDGPAFVIRFPLLRAAREVDEGALAPPLPASAK